MIFQNNIATSGPLDAQISRPFSFIFNKINIYFGWSSPSIAVLSTFGFVGFSYLPSPRFSLGYALLTTVLLWALISTIFRWRSALAEIENLEALPIEAYGIIMRMFTLRRFSPIEAFLLFFGLRQGAVSITGIATTALAMLFYLSLTYALCAVIPPKKSRLKSFLASFKPSSRNLPLLSPSQ